MIAGALQASQIPKKRRLGDVNLVPGMPVEVFVKTEDRTVASYLARPIMDQFNRAFREETGTTPRAYRALQRYTAVEG